MQKHLIVVGAAVVTAAVISLFSARRIEAQYASPVQVKNSAAAPALTSRIDERGRIPYQSIAFKSTCPGFSECIFDNFAVVPSGHRLVITQLSAKFGIGPASPDTTLQVDLTGGNSTTGFDHSWTVPMPANLFAVLFQPVTAYVDGGQTFFVSAQLGSASGSPKFSTAAGVTVAGYLLDCTAAPCASIAH
jgi:hypothetical protein